MFNEFKINSSFTLENSFFTKELACSSNEHKDTQHSEKKAREADSDDLESIEGNKSEQIEEDEAPSSPVKEYDQGQGYHHFTS